MLIFFRPFGVVRATVDRVPRLLQVFEEETQMMGSQKEPSSSPTTHLITSFIDRYNKVVALAKDGAKKEEPGHQVERHHFVQSFAAPRLGQRWRSQTTTFLYQSCQTTTTSTAIQRWLQRCICGGIVVFCVIGCSWPRPKRDALLSRQQDAAQHAIRTNQQAARMGKTHRRAT